MTENSFDSGKKQLQVLVVDDNAINLRLLIASVTRLGHRVDSAENGLVAVDKFTSKHFDVILMDIMMPVMDGIAASCEIRKIETERQTGPDDRVKIIAITANSFEDDRTRLFEAGMDYYMSKPFEISELQRILNL